MKNITSKKSWFLLVLLFIAGVANAQEKTQRFHFGPKIGLSCTDIRYKDIYNSYYQFAEGTIAYTNMTLNFSVGVVFEYDLIPAKKYGLSIDIVPQYAEKGCWYLSENLSGHFYWHYVDIPVELRGKYRITNRNYLILGLGPTFNIGINQVNKSQEPIENDIKHYISILQFGENGNCAHTIFEGDAATKLTEKCQAMLNPNRTRTDGDTISPYNNSIYDVEHACKNYNDLQSLVNGLDYWLFHAENLIPEEVSEYCISYNYLNLYLRNLHGAVISRNGCLHYSTNHHSPIREIVIHCADNDGESLKDIWHYAEMTYYKYGLPY